MSIERAIEQIDSRTQEVPSNWHAGKGLSDGVTWAEVREWLASLAALPCNCENGEAYGHHVWCDTYRPAGMPDAEWEAALEAHPLRVPLVLAEAWDEGSRSATYPDGSAIEVERHRPPNPYRRQK